MVERISHLLLKTCLIAIKIMACLVVPAALVLTIFTAPIRPHDATMAQCIMWPYPVPAKLSEGAAHGPTCDQVTLDEVVALPGADEVESLSFRFSAEVPATDMSSLTSLHSLNVTGPAVDVEHSIYTVPNLKNFGSSLEVAQNIDFTKMPKSFQTLSIEVESDVVDLSWIKPANNMAILVTNKTENATYYVADEGKKTAFRAEDLGLSKPDFLTSTGTKMVVAALEFNEGPGAYDLIDLGREFVGYNPLRVFLR